MLLTSQIIAAYNRLLVAGIDQKKPSKKLVKAINDLLETMEHKLALRAPEEGYWRYNYETREHYWQPSQPQLEIEGGEK